MTEEQNPQRDEGQGPGGWPWPWLKHINGDIILRLPEYDPNGLTTGTKFVRVVDSLGDTVFTVDSGGELKGYWRGGSEPMVWHLGPAWFTFYDGASPNNRILELSGDGPARFPADVVGYSGQDFADETYGLYQRLFYRGVNWGCDFHPSDSPGFAWLTDATFHGTPTSVDVDYRNSYMIVKANNSPHYYCKSVTGGRNFKYMWARIRTGDITDFGIRADDSDNDYVEIYLDAGGDGTYVPRFRWRIGGGAITDHAANIALATEFITVCLERNATTGIWYGYLVSEDGNLVNVAGWNSGADAVPVDRYGFVVRNNAGDYAAVDWYGYEET
jgi:hypothetical protein